MFLLFSCDAFRQAMYAKIDTDDEGDVTIRKVVEHIRAVEAGSGNNNWVKAKTWCQQHNNA